MYRLTADAKDQFAFLPNADGRLIASAPSGK